MDYTRYRLLFKHPFGTAHGQRDGTDAVFLRLTGPAGIGYGEAALPPYVKERPDSVIHELQSIDIQQYVHSYPKLPSNPGKEHWDTLSPASRAALSTAVLDYSARTQGISVSQYMGIGHAGVESPKTTVTIGLGSAEDIGQKISELPISDWIKIKLGGPNDKERIRTILACDARPLFLDANQGWSSVDEALEIIAVVDPDRLSGVEQPFAKEQWELHAALQVELRVPVYGDESIQGMEDLERAVGVFGGVNIKLMKCGGLDVALGMAERSKELGLQVMLGCMSESTLGCAAMAQLQPLAQILDLDGPWLLRNDPFSGLSMSEEGVWTKEEPGCGVCLTAQLDWHPFGA